MKSSLVLRFVKDQFDDYRESTIGGMLLSSLLCGRNQLTYDKLLFLHRQ